MKDLSGQRFGRLIARQPTAKRSGTSVVWECLCDCGNAALVKSAHLCSGRTRSCGCLKKEYIKQNNLAAAEAMIGQRFGRLTVIAQSNERKNGHILWECRCACGNIILAAKSPLKNGTTQSCGCLHKEIMKEQGHKSLLDLAGQRFGKLIVIRLTEERIRKSAVWECRCDCGNTAFITSKNLKSGTTRSCGCLRKQKKNGCVE